MGKAKKKTSPPITEPATQETDENVESDSEANEAWMQKYTGENHMTHFKNIIRVQAKEVMKEVITQEVHQQLQSKLKEMSDAHEKLRKEARDTIESLETEVGKIKRRVEKLEFSNAQKETKIKDLKLKLDAAEQMKYDHSLQIVGLPEVKDGVEESKQIIKMSKELGIKMKSNDIEDITRLGKKKDHKRRNVIVKLKDKSVREKMFEQRKKLVKDSDPKKNVYINDRLTKYRQNLLFASRKLVKSKKLFAAWSQHGNVLIRKTENSKIIAVQRHDDLMNIKYNDDSSTEHRSDLTLSELARPSRDTLSIISHLSDYDYYVDSDLN